MSTVEERVSHWRDYAACRGIDPEVFFPETLEEEFEAKRVCAGCHVREACLQYALTTGQKDGIWGGLNRRERRRVQVRCVEPAQRCPSCAGVLIPDGPKYERCVDCKVRWFAC